MNKPENVQLPSKPIAANMALLAERERVGLTKYGVTLGDAGLSHEALLQHGLEEALDLANYLQASLQAQATYKELYLDLVKQVKDLRKELVCFRDKPYNLHKEFMRMMERAVVTASKKGVDICLF